MTGFDGMDVRPWRLAANCDICWDICCCDIGMPCCMLARFCKFWNIDATVGRYDRSVILSYMMKQSRKGKDLCNVLFPLIWNIILCYYDNGRLLCFDYKTLKKIYLYTFILARGRNALVSIQLGTLTVVYVLLEIIIYLSIHPAI